MKLWYCDRAQLVVSTVFDFVEVRLSGIFLETQGDMSRRTLALYSILSSQSPSRSDMPLAGTLRYPS